MYVLTHLLTDLQYLRQRGRPFAANVCGAEERARLGGRERVAERARVAAHYRMELVGTEGRAWQCDGDVTAM